MISPDATEAAASSTPPSHHPEAPAQNKSPAHSRALSASSKRRSVSSMRSLLPLTLSPSSSASSVFSTTEESVGVQLDGYFPEVLAKDLDRSSAVFAARNMTSGFPDASIALREKTPSPAPTWPTHSAAGSQHRTSSGQCRSLRPIQERNSVVSFLDRRGSRDEDLATDQESVSGTELSRSAEAPSINFHEQSIVTAATSLTSSSWGPWSRNSPRCGQSRENSWIQMDSDDDHDAELAGDENITNLSPRPPTPPDSEAGSNSSFEARSPASTVYYTPSPEKSHSLVGVAPLSPLPRRRSVRKMESPDDSLGLRHTAEYTKKRALPLSAHAQSSEPRQRAASLQSPFHSASSSLSVSRPQVNRQRSTRRHVRVCTEPSNTLAELSAELNDEDYLEPKSPTEANAFCTEPMPSVSQFLDIHACITNSTRPYTSHGTGDDVIKLVPLPPNVIETLRVSVTCFPETMLLSSSLTVDTIRSYSRKVRQPGADPLDKLTPDLPTAGARKSIWKRVVSYKRHPSISLSKNRDVHPTISGEPEPRPPTSQNINTMHPWAPLKNVFPHCSDYICDALWAHIVAYNYISAVLPRPPPHTGKAARGRPSVSNDSQKDDVPKKAALLLGLGDHHETNPSVERIARKLGASASLWNLGREGMIADQPSRSPGYDNAVRDIRAGLLRCILRLTATAKLMTEDGTGAERMVEMEPHNVDVLFTRSLFEIVRISEDASVYGSGRC